MRAARASQGVKLMNRPRLEVPKLRLVPAGVRGGPLALLAGACFTVFGGAACGGGGSSGAPVSAGDDSGAAVGSDASPGTGGGSGGSSGSSGSSGGGAVGADAGAASPGADAGPGDSGGGTKPGEAGAGATDGGVSGGGLFDHCSLDGGCLADCSPPANDPIATGNASYDLYDGCILAAMAVAGMTEPWQGQLLKAQAYNESGITPMVTTNDGTCGGQNCGIWAISAGTVSGDSPPGPCGSSATDPLTGSVDYSHSYGIFQDTPACEGTFLQPSLPAGHTCTPTGTADNIPFGTNVTFYCESATSLGVSTPNGTKKGYINVVQDPKDPLYATSVFNPAYDLYVYFDVSWGLNFQQANAGAKGCTLVQQWYLSLAYWLTGNATTSCTLTGAGKQYVQTAITDYETVLYNKKWPYPAP